MGTTNSVFEQIFTSEYSLQNFKYFVSEFFNNVDWVSEKQIKDYWNWTEFSVFIDGYTHLANYKGADNNTVSIFAVEMKKGQNIDRARSAQRNFVKKLIENGNCQAAIVAFYSSNDFKKWRLSFVKLDYEFTAGKIKQRITPAKRYSYLVGKGEPCRTAQVRLLSILQNEKSNPTLEEMEEAFSVEKITKEFFEQYKNKYIQLKEHLEATPEFIEESIKHHFTAEQFSKKLMGQIAFLYFVQKKGWLGVNALPRILTEKQYKKAFYIISSSKRYVISKVYIQDNNLNYNIDSSKLKELTEDEEIILAKALKGEPWGTGPRDFMRKLYKNCTAKKENYFDDYLEPLFYEALNKSRGDSSYYPRLHCKIPFLNGGLFEALDNYDWENNIFNIPNEMFSNKDIKGDWDADGILDVFDRYNFTMNEDEPLEKEVAVDPEMLGKIFENLLDIKDRKSKGAFYTPREIVHYMCQESIVNYLVNETGLEYTDLKDFILYGEFMKDEDTTREVKDGLVEMYISKNIFDIPSKVNRLHEIDKALSTITVCDPAVGSGAFPLGMINEIVKARTNITAYLALLEKNPQNRLIMHQGTRHPYKLKLNTIKNCIYAVDIEPSAVDITKLRLWLSLVVDEETDPDADELSMFIASKDPKPLPNLDCNIRCGNSLIDEINGIKLINESDLFGNQEFQVSMGQNIYEEMLKELFDAQDKLFSEKDHDNKTKLKAKIQAIKDQIILLNISQTKAEEQYINTKDDASLPYMLWKLEFAKVFKEKGGFDVVIGNPPYIGQSGNKEIFREVKATTFGAKYHQRRMDFHYFFYHKGIDLLKDHGHLMLITTNYFLDATNADKLREDIKSRTNILGIINFNELKIFESATGQHNLIMLLRKSVNDKNVSIMRTKRRGFANSTILSSIFSGQDDKTEYLTF